MARTGGSKARNPEERDRRGSFSRQFWVLVGINVVLSYFRETSGMESCRLFLSGPRGSGVQSATPSSFHGIAPLRLQVKERAATSSLINLLCSEVSCV